MDNSGMRVCNNTHFFFRQHFFSLSLPSFSWWLLSELMIHTLLTGNYRDPQQDLHVHKCASWVEFQVQDVTHNSSTVTVPLSLESGQNPLRNGLRWWNIGRIRALLLFCLNSSSGRSCWHITLKKNFSLDNVEFSVNHGEKCFRWPYQTIVVNMNWDNEWNESCDCKIKIQAILLNQALKPI